MKLQSVVDLKQEVLSDLRQEADHLAQTEMQGLVDPRVESRLAVGYSRYGKSEFQLELRVQRGRGTAYKRAEKIKEQSNGEARIEVVHKIEIPSRKTLSETTSDVKRLSKPVRPLHIGLSVGHPAGGAGTLGAFLETPHGDAILSNNHVLALFGQAELKDPIYQPGKPDRKNLLATDRVGRLVNYVDVARGSRNEVDSAIALLDDEVEHLSNKVPGGLNCPYEGKTIKEVAGYDQLGSDAVVCKIGRTTGFSTGRVTAVALDNVPILTPSGNVLFDNVIEVQWESAEKPFSQPGDSGSLVFTAESLLAVGLLFAGGSRLVEERWSGVTYCCNLQTILNDYEATLLG